MRPHTVVLMKDGEKEHASHPESAAEALRLAQELVGRCRQGRGCYKLTIEGPSVNLHGTVDMPAVPAEGPRPSPTAQATPRPPGWGRGAIPRPRR